MKKRFYDENGNEIRSRPAKPFYKKSWFLLIIGVAAIVGFFVLNGEEDLKDKEPAEQEIAKADELVKETATAVEPEEDETYEEPTYAYDDFKGTYAVFEGEPYKSPISYAVTINDDSILTHHVTDDDETFEMTYSTASVAIVNQMIEGNVLTLNWAWDADFDGTFELAISYEGNQKSLHNISTEDTFLSKNTSTLYSMSKQDLLDQYDQVEIDYARIVLMTYADNLADQENPVVYVRKITAGETLSDYIDIPVLYPEDVTYLSSTTAMANMINSVVYSSNGDGYITTYPEPRYFEELFATSEEDLEDITKTAQSMIDEAKSFYVDPSEPWLVAYFIGRVEFVYVNE